MTKNKKIFYGVLVVVVLVVGGTGWYLVKKPITPFLQPPLTPEEEYQTRMKDAAEVERAIQEANFCNTAEDCTPLGVYCPFSSWETYVNNNKKEKIQKMIEDFNKKHPVHSKCEPSYCHNISPVECIEKKCYVECRDVERQIIITTDKTEYEQGEEIEVTIHNHLSEQIWIPIFHAPGVNCLVEVEKFIDDKWETIFSEYSKERYLKPQFIEYQDFKQISSQERMSRVAWDQTVIFIGETVSASPGEYRILLNYYTINPKAAENPEILEKNFRQAYSNKFRLKGPEVIEGVLLDISGGGITREPHFTTSLNISIAHVCDKEDELVLKEIKLYGEKEKPIYSFSINKTLEIAKLLKEFLKTLPEQEKLIVSFRKAAEEGKEPTLEEAIPHFFSYPSEVREKEIFILDYLRYFSLDLREFKKELKPGDEIPITVVANFIHNGKPLSLEKAVKAQYGFSLPGARREDVYLQDLTSDSLINDLILFDVKGKYNLGLDAGIQEKEGILAKLTLTSSKDGNRIGFHLLLWHNCEVEDGLILKKIEIYGRNETPIKTFEVNGPMKSIEKDIERITSLKDEYALTEDEEKRVNLSRKAYLLAQDIRCKMFSSDMFWANLDEVRDPSISEDKIPIPVKVHLMHRGKPSILEITWMKNLTSY